MSTRGTYQITYKGDYRDTSICVYCHHDNYPIGAATRFNETLKLRKSLKKKYLNNDFLECFIAANVKNTLLEITTNHNHHLDADYSYDITITDAIYLKAYKHVYYNNDENFRRQIFFEGSISDFIKLELTAENIKEAA